jgi:DNA methylase
VTARLLVGDVFERIRQIPDGSVDAVICSPPFWGLRSYGADDRELGSESNPAAFIDNLLRLTGEFRRVLAPHGSIAIELGDTLANSGGAGGDYNENGLRAGQPKFRQGTPRWDGRPEGQIRTTTSDPVSYPPRGSLGSPLPKSLCGIPEAYALSLEYGWNVLDRHGPDSPAGRWRVRNKLVWARPNPPVGALGDKARPATSYITVACTSANRWFDLDAVRTAHKFPDATHTVGNVSATRGDFGQPDKRIENHPAGAPPLDWWDELAVLIDANLRKAAAGELNEPDLFGGEEGTGKKKTQKETAGQRLLREAWAAGIVDYGDVLPLTTQAYKGAHYACVDDQTEALTPYGWRWHGDLRDGDLIAAYDAGSETWRFEPATFHRYDYSGDLVAIDKRVTNQRLTPNHRVLYRTRKDQTPRVREASTLSTICQLPVAVEMEAGGVGPGEKAAALAGWFITEGGIVSGWPVIYQSESANPAKVQTIRSLLDGIGADYHERTRPQRVGVTGKSHILTVFTIKGALAEWLRQFHKNLAPSTVFGWSDIDARALFEAMVDGDGHRRPDGRMQFVQKSRAVADSFQMLATRLGYRTTLASRGATWAVYVSPGRWVDLRAGRNGSDQAVGHEYYEGIVWCPSVPSTFWLARRNGQPFITGNTWPPNLAKRLIEMMCPLRVCTVCGEPSRRIVGEASYSDKNGRPVLAHVWQSGSTNGTGAHSAKTQDPSGTTRSALTLGWTDCGHDNWRRGHVLDPFAGSGTTLSVAEGCGRDATGIELYEHAAACFLR